MEGTLKAFSSALQSTPLERKGLRGLRWYQLEPHVLAICFHRVFYILISTIPGSYNLPLRVCSQDLGTTHKGRITFTC